MRPGVASRPCRSVRKAFACVARVCRAVKLQGTRPGVASARVESVKLRGNSTGRATRCRVESVKLRGNSTGRASSRLRPCRIRQAKGELHRARVQVSGHASRCRLPPVSKRPQSVRAVKLRGNSTGHAPRCRLRSVSESVKLRGNSRVSRGVSPRWCAESVQLRENSTGHAPRCRSVRKAFGCVARVCRAVKLRGNSTGHAPRCRLRSVLHPSS